MSSRGRCRRGFHGPVAVVHLALAATLAFSVTSAYAQGGPSVAELERLLGERQAAISVLQARLARLEAIGDSLVRAKRGAGVGSAQYQRVSNQIRENSDQVRPIQRDLRQLYDQARSLQQDLFVRYNVLVGETNQRIQELRREGRTPQSSPELRGLVDVLPEYMTARDRYEEAVQEEQCAPWLPDLVLDPLDGPSQFRYKEALARDLVDKIDTCIAGIQKQIDNIAMRERIREETERVQRDLELWGEQAANDQIEEMLKGRGRNRIGTENPFDDPRSRIQQLQRRGLELVERREEYEAKARLFAQRLREFYP
jgi:hypothetical protein